MSRGVSADTIAKFEQCCDLMQKNGITASAARKIVGMTAGSFHNAIDSSPERAELYARANELSCDALHDQMLEICEMRDVDFNDDPRKLSVIVQQRKLLADNVKWSLSKRLTKKYGDRITHAGAADAPVVVKIDGNDALV